MYMLIPVIISYLQIRKELETGKVVYEQPGEGMLIILQEQHLVFGQED